MAVSANNKKIIDAIKKSDLTEYKHLNNLLNMALNIYSEDEADLYYSLNITGFIKKHIPTLSHTEELLDLYWRAVLFEAQHQVLDSALLYLEKNRDAEDRFYQPRRKEFTEIGLIQDLQDLLDDNLDVLSISMPPGVGKTTLGEMFIALYMGWYPDVCNLFSSHSGHVTRMVYDVVNNIIGANIKKGQIAEYAWREIFPEVQVEAVNAREETINLGKFKPFKSLTCRALGASQTGVTRAEGILYCDDLCSGIEEALSKVRLDKLFTMYSTDLKTRKKMGKGGKRCKELHIATRWSVWDVIGRIKTIYANDKRCRFVSVPDINPETNKSNFNYRYGVGFDESYFEDIEKTLDDVTYRCLYKNEPIEREGLLYDPDVLRRYFDVLPPEREPDAIIGILDPKGSGTDFNGLGIFYQHGQDYYLHDVVFKNIDPYLLDDFNADCLTRNNTQICQVESNKEGVRTGDVLQDKVKERGGACSIDKKYTTSNKETRIIVNSPWVIEHVIFKDSSCYEPKSDYGVFMSHLCGYSQLGKNANDDAPDMVSMLAVRETNGVASVQVLSRSVLYG